VRDPALTNLIFNAVDAMPDGAAPLTLRNPPPHKRKYGGVTIVDALSAGR